MSANIGKYCVVNNLDEIKPILVPEDKTKQEILRDDDWDNRWNWDTSDMVYDADEDESKKNLWLMDCSIALSPFSDTLVIGRNQLLTIFHLKINSNTVNHHDFDNSTALMDANLVYSTSLPGLEKDECLTKILLLPFFAQQKTSINFRDWTAILIGFNSGYLRIYAENGKLLFEYLFHDEPVLEIKCRTHSTNSLLSEQMDEILLIYSSAVVQIDGFTLFQILRIRRNNLAKQSPQNDFVEQQFTFKKFAFENAESDGQMSDCSNVCTYVKNDFDAMVSHTITNTAFNNDSANLFVTTGMHPFIGFYRAQEGTSHTILSELSQVLFNKVKNVLSFFSQSKPKEVDPKEKIKPATKVECNVGLYDERLGFKICLSPNRRLAAVVDDFGRVILFDVQNAIVVRIWKGYRKAEVGWIVVEEDSSRTLENSKKAFFLVIYAPKRGILEIWCTQNGPRVAAFRVGKNCKIVYMEHMMFGLNHLILHNIKQSMTTDDFLKLFSYSKCLLFNFETGELFNFNVPFLCALTDRKSKKTRDVHILKDLKVHLKKQNNFTSENLIKFHQQIVSLVLMLKTAEIRREFLDELIKLSNDEQLINLCAQKMLQEFLKSIEKNELDFENKLVAQMCVRIIQVCGLCIEAKRKLPQLQLQMNTLARESVDPPDIQQLIETLGGWSGNDIARILSLLAFRQSVLKSSQASIFNDLNILEQFTISDLLSHFTLYYSHLIKENNVEIYEKLPIEIILMRKEQLLDGNRKHIVALDRLSRFLFNASFCGDESNTSYLLNEACIYPSNLLLLLFTSWLESSYSKHWRCWENFSKALFKIVDIMNEIRNNEDLKGENLLFDPSFDDRFLSMSWTDIIELIYRSSNITSALVSVNMIKSLINKLKLNANDISEISHKENEISGNSIENLNDDLVAKKSSDIISTNSVLSSDSEWETLHLDKENLCMLTKQLEDLFLLDMLLKSNLCSLEMDEDLNLKLFHDTESKNNMHQLSLSYILTSGPGIVSEIVARWAIHHRISPELLICSSCVEADQFNQDDSVTIADETTGLKRSVEDSQNTESDLSMLSDRSTLMEILKHVRRCFPNCLESDILLINCCWELLLLWNRQPLIHTGDLVLTLDYLENVSSSVLKHNIACMGWRLFVQKRFETLCNLIEKMGKKPKDRICRKELEMDENTLEQFVAFCCSFLDFMIRTNFSSETEPLPLYALDEWWCGFNASNQYSSHFADELASKVSYDQQVLLSSTSSKTQFGSDLFSSNVPLAVMAMHQKIANVNLLMEYLHLALSVQFTVIFSLKNVHPLSLFSSSVQAYLFKDLYSFLTSNSSDLSSVSSDPVLNQTRLQFLFNVINAIAQTLPVHRTDNDRSEAVKFYLIANKWFNKVVLLCREWNLVVDQMRLRYVCDLYLFGCDPLAEELIATVSDIKSLGRQLLVIAGIRLMFALNLRFGSLDEISFIPPNVLFWLRSLVTDPNCNGDCPLPATVSLLEQIGNLLHDDGANFRICQELLSAAKNL